MDSKVEGALADLALVGGSLAIAASVVAFAGYMTFAGADAPGVNGLQYLAIFAQPRHSPRDADASVGVDMTPTGALRKERVAGYALVGAQERFAWLREGDRIFAVRPGDDVPRLGRVATIAPRDGRWALLDASGATLILGRALGPAPVPGARFDRRMIFR